MSQVLFVGMHGVISRGSPAIVTPTAWPVK